LKSHPPPIVPTLEHGFEYKPHDHVSLVDRWRIAWLWRRKS
jgi:hypothetical protein